jgi:hypothetical protein
VLHVQDGQEGEVLRLPASEVEQPSQAGASSDARSTRPRGPSTTRRPPMRTRGLVVGTSTMLAGQSTTARDRHGSAQGLGDQHAEFPVVGRGPVLGLVLDLAQRRFPARRVRGIVCTTPAGTLTTHSAVPVEQGETSRMRRSLIEPLRLAARSGDLAST